jgi:SagB-type dehydrogenase family enzyme
VAALTRFRPDVALEREDDALIVAHPWGRFRLRGVAPHEAAALAALADGSPDALAELRDPLRERIAPLVERTVVIGDRKLATAVPMTPDATLRACDPVTADTAVRPSRVAYLHSGLLESPLSRHRVVFHDGAAAALVGALGGTVGDAAHAVTLPLDAVLALVDLLLAARLAELDGEPEDPAVALWDFHDLVFHARSRAGRHDHPFGGVYRHAETQPPLPAIAPRRPGPLLELPRIDWDEVVARDPTLTEALEGRRSLRDYDDAPVTLAQLGELLYRAARVRSVVPADAKAGLPYDALDRPFPTGGASGELELYVTVARCEGLDAGVYHYDAAAHGLRKLDSSERDRAELLGGAWRAAAQRVDPQVLITITSRFGRLSWKYSAIAYALTLKHVGVLYQTLYLVATAMGLAPCGLGSGDSDVAARAFGLDWASESSVGEFLIGSRRTDAPGLPTAFADVVVSERA